MMKVWKINLLAILLASAVCSMSASPAFAINLHSKYAAALVAPYDPCPGHDPGATADVEDETSTTSCYGAASQASPWYFEQGTVEIDNTEVGLRLDNLRVLSSCLDVKNEKKCITYLNTCSTNSDCTPGEKCSSVACSCYDESGSTYNCISNNECGGTGCGPRNGSSADATNNNYFNVVIWQQQYCAAGSGCPKMNLCKDTVHFDVKNVAGNVNEDVDQTQSWSTTCSGSGEIRHVEVFDKYGNTVAVAGR